MLCVFLANLSHKSNQDLSQLLISLSLNGYKMLWRDLRVSDFLKTKKLHDPLLLGVESPHDHIQDSLDLECLESFDEVSFVYKHVIDGFDNDLGQEGVKCIQVCETK